PRARQGDRQEGNLQAGPGRHHARASGAEPARRGRAGRRDRPHGRSPAVIAADHSYFEDVVPGEPHETPAITLTQAHVTQFLGLTGDWPDHVADKTPAVPNLLPLCISSGLGFRVPAPPLAVLAFMGFEWRFLQT